MNRLTTGLAALAAGLLAAACAAAGPQASPAGTAVAVPTDAAATPAATQPAATQPAAATDEPAIGATPPTGGGATTDPLAPPHVFPDLEARIPGNVGGIAIQTASFGANFGEGALSEDFQTAIAQVGLEVDAVQLATAGPADDVEADISIVAFRLPGVDAAQFLVTLRTVAEQNPDSEATMTDTTIAGKNVVALTEGDNTQYAYPSGDVFFIVGGDPALVEAALTAIQ